MMRTWRYALRRGVRTLSSASRPPACGQPLPHTHPHLFPIDFRMGTNPVDGGGVAFDHLTPGIPATEYENRRRALMDRLPPNSVVVLMGVGAAALALDVLVVRRRRRFRMKDLHPALQA